MIDVYAAAGTFPARHRLAQDLAAAVSIANVAGETNYLRVRVLTPTGVLDREKQVGVVKELTDIVAAAAGPLGMAERTWVLLTEAPERNRAKIQATVENARAISTASTPQAEKLAKQLKSQGSRFVGPTSVYAFMQNIGAVNDHIHGCIRATDYTQPQTNY